MGASNDELLKTIRYYQESLDKYSSGRNNHKLLSVIEKLKKLPIATSHLEETGIGRTVNALRKLGGDVGDAAKGLVAKWKEMVVQEEVKAKEEAVHEPVNAVYSSENEAENCEEAENSCDETKQKDKESSSSHRSTDTEKKHSEKHRKEVDKYSSSNRRSSHEKRDSHRDKKSSSKKRRQESDSSSEEHSSKRRHNSSSSESEEEVLERKHSKSKSKRRHKSESSEDEETERKQKSKKSKHSKDSSDSEDSHRRHKSRTSKSSSSSSKSKSRGKTETKSQDDDSSPDRAEEKSKSKHGSDMKIKRDSDCEEKSSSKHKSRKNYESNSDTEEKHKSKHESKSRHERESSKAKSHSEKKDKKDSKREESKDKHSHKKDESRKHDEKYRKFKEEVSKKEKSSSSSKSEENGKSSSSKHKSSSEKKSKEKVKPLPVNPEKIVNGIDSGSGASFAEALGMCGPVSAKASSSSSSSTKKKSSTTSSSEKPRSSSSSQVKPAKTEPEEEENVPILLKEQPSEPLNINISSLLPEITPHYRPLGFPIDSQPKRVLTQDEALSQVISNKNMRTKVYSGNKSHGKVDSLFDLCVRILQDNIDALEYTGGVPYSILKPVLDKATPDQLFNMEHHNPYLIEDTDGLWHLHCQKEFRNKKREELESWREMYMRCLDEREARLNAITANIKISQDKSTPLRTTKLAYIDSVVKPPRNILRKQVKNGIVFDKKPAQTPSSRLAALATSGDAGKVAVSNPGTRAVERSSSSSSAAMKPKKAPLMAKTLSLFKNRFRR